MDTHCYLERLALRLRVIRSRVWIPLGAEFSPLLYRSSLHRALYYYPSSRVSLNGVKCDVKQLIGGGRVCILRHRGVQLKLAYSWTRPAILVVGKDRWGTFLFLLILHFHSCSSFSPVPLFHLLYPLFCLSSTYKCWRVIKPKRNKKTPNHHNHLEL